MKTLSLGAGLLEETSEWEHENVQPDSPSNTDENGVPRFLGGSPFSTLAPASPSPSRTQPEEKEGAGNDGPGAPLPRTTPECWKGLPKDDLSLGAVVVKGHLRLR